MISIIIPTYNRAHLLPETLESIINQTYKLWECIIVDDGSTDNTSEILEFYEKKDSRIKSYKRPANKPKGANACRNYGFELSQGELIHFFDSDDLMHPEHLEKKQQIFENNKNIDFCLCQTQNFEGLFLEKNLKEITINKFTGDIYTDYILGRCSILMITPTWRREVLMNSTLFDENLLQSQDMELYSRILLKFKSFEIIEEILIYVRRNNNSITTLNGKLNIFIESYLEVKRRVLLQAPNNAEINLALVKMVLGVFRHQLASKQYEDCNKCLAFVNTYNCNKTIKFKYALLRINFFYQVFKIAGRGDTKFKSLLKL
ncbi:glycosyltransferase family 2 protein [Flavobacterium sp. LC2016-12]|uniref:glycosyltransferase family 2 protein n=1 Tax=Flavobacterium sp. LC2016-12 TaxID=2783794 RepID=UPI00188CE190|nr:glycosyltransferase family 2 protein [Flavobacterium sp. LC2016-12]MBF4465652.1 glycosyltransferase family 2 protein [Flavobacterium sp. LC2016-12]